MATIKELALKRSDIFYVDPRVLKIKDGWNARSADDPANRAHVTELADSIAQVGVQEPLTVYYENAQIWVSDGHCRLAATLFAINKGADIKAIPVKTEGRAANEADHVFSQIIRNAGKPLTPFEAGTVYKRLVGYGWTVEQIALKSGKSKASIDAALDLQGAPVQVQKLVASGRVSATLATETLKKEGATKATKTLNDAVDVAAQKGKARATKADIGEAPVTKLTAAGKLARIREIVDEAGEIENDSEGVITPGYVALEFAPGECKELLKLLGL